MALVARNVVEALLASGPLQPSWGTKRLQAPCLALLLLAQLISGPDAHMAAGTSGKSSVPGTTERAASLWWRSGEGSRCSVDAAAAAAGLGGAEIGGTGLGGGAGAGGGGGEGGCEQSPPASCSKQPQNCAL